MDYLIGYFFLPFFLCAGSLALLPLSEQSFLHKLLLSLLLTLWLSNFITQPANASSHWPLEIPFVFIAGVMLTLPVVLFLAALTFWGELFDLGRGQHMGGVLDPLHQAQESTTAVLLKNAAWVSVLYAGFGETLLKALGRTVNTLPFFESLSFSLLQSKALLLWSSIADLLSQSLLMFLPLAALFLLIELSAAFLGKLMPQLSLSTENFSCKLLLSSLALYYLCETQLIEHYSRVVVEKIVQHML